jgi:predicted metal-binding membrane protein
MGLGIETSAAVWTLMMAAMMLPSVTPFVSLYIRTFTDRRGTRMFALTVGYLLVWSLAALPAYGLAWLVTGAPGGTLWSRRGWPYSSSPPAASTNSPR